MNERLKELAEQAGGVWSEDWGCFMSGTLNLTRFAELVRQDEREACIDVVMQNVSPAMSRECEDAIRARSKNT
jgi:hypothetical protein